MAILTLLPLSMEELTAAEYEIDSLEDIMCIESSVHYKIESPAQVVEKARKLRGKTTDSPISDEEFNRIKEAKRL